MSQSRMMSLVEAGTNVAVGFGVAVTTQALVFPMFGWHAPASTHFAIAAIFTVVSIVRSYLLRRFFNRFVRRAAR